VALLVDALRLGCAVALPFALGLLLLWAVGGERLPLGRWERWASAWALGWGALTLEMLGVGLAGRGSWSPLVLLALWGGTATLAVGVRALSGPLRPPRGPSGGDDLVLGAPSPAGHSGRGRYLWLAAGLVVGQWATVALHAIAWPVNDLDAWSIWAFKARIFSMSQGIPWAYFGDASKLFSHPDYPLLVPLAETWIYGWLGRPDDQAMMVLFALSAAGTVAITAGALHRVYGRVGALLGAAGLLCVPFFVARGPTGDADVPLALYSAASMAYLWRWLDGPERRTKGLLALVLCGVFGGLGAWTKKEGLLLCALTMPVVALAAWRRIDLGGPAAPTMKARAAGRAVGVFGLAAAAVAGPWLLFVAVRRPLTRDFLPFTVQTLVAHLDRLPVIAGFVGLRLLDVSRWNLIWVGLAGAVVLHRRALRRGGPLAYLLALLCLQVAVDGALFVFSDWQPYTLHLRTALDRLLLHSLPLAVMLLVALVVGRPGQEGPASG